MSSSTTDLAAVGKAPARKRRARCAALLAGGAGLLALLLPGAGGAWVTNLVELDDGTCDTNLQIGSDKAASASRTPTFFLRGDGGLSSYAMWIDGNPIGTFYSAGNAVVCVQAPAPLRDGAHVLTGNELAPHPTYVLTPLAFSVDTVPPLPPSTPVLSGYSDSGVQGDGITRFRNINVTGTAGPNEPVQLRSNGITGIGGARADATGHWSATSVSLPDGSYTLAAHTLDSAGNRSVLSPSSRLTIDSVPPATPSAPTLDGSAVTGTAARDVATLHVVSDGAEVGTATLGGRKRAWRLALPALTPGAHTIVVTAADAADNVSPPSRPATFTLPGPPPDPAPSPPASESRPAPPDLPRPQSPRPPRPT